MWCPRDFAREYPSPVVPNCGAALPPDAMSTFDAFVVQSLPFFVSLNVTENEPLSLTIFSAAADVMISVLPVSADPLASSSIFTTSEAWFEYG